MKKLESIISRDEIPAVISELEGLVGESPVISVAAIHILKNELEPWPADAARRELVFEAQFELPTRGVRRWLAGEGGGWASAARGLAGDLGAWAAGRDSERFRDRCDRSFFEEIVPVVEAHFDELAEPFMNTINEAIINYAEHSFMRWAFARRVRVQIFRTQGDLAYCIVRPGGIGLRTFDPLSLQEKRPGALANLRRGWGHTLLMQRALFISFDKAPRRRGLMVVIGLKDGA